MKKKYLINFFVYKTNLYNIIKYIYNIILLIKYNCKYPLISIIYKIKKKNSVRYFDLNQYLYEERHYLQNFR